MAIKTGVEVGHWGDILVTLEDEVYVLDMSEAEELAQIILRALDEAEVTPNPQYQQRIVRRGDKSGLTYHTAGTVEEEISRILQGKGFDV